jgi:pimeloyl-ACP methyl ester carboxylesterase
MSSQLIFDNLAIFVILALLALMGAGQIKKTYLKSKYAPVGRLVDIGGYRLHITCRGRGGPSVILDAGQGETSLSWDAIQGELVLTTQVCAYDRAGLGWSDPSPHPRTAKVMANELHQLLEKAGVPKPYILVGASLGGLNARVFAHLYPDEVGGLVLLDAAHEEQYLPEAIQNALQKMSGMMLVMSGYVQLVVRSGLAALFPRLLPAGGSDHTRAARLDRILRVARTGYLKASMQEIKDIQLSHAEVREMRIASLGDMPILVIRHGKVQQQMMPGIIEEMEETNRWLQAKVAGQSSNSSLIVAEESGHAIHVDQPDLVIDAILRVVELVREQAQIRPSKAGFPNVYIEAASVEA